MREILPKGWCELPISSIAEHIRGVSYKKKDIRFEMIDEYIPLLRANNINGAINHNDLQYVPRNIIKTKQLLQKGDVLIAMSSGSKKVVGKTAPILEERDETFGAFCGVLRLFPFLEMGIFPYFFQTQYYRNKISELATGTNINNIKISHFSEICISIPPLPEQKRIVAKLDKIMPRIDKVKERLEKIPTTIKRFRQSVLTDAVTGKLTEKWRKEHLDVESAEKLLERIRKEQIYLYKQKKTSKPKSPTIIHENEKKYEIKNNWKWCRLSQVSLKMSTGPFGSMLHKSDYISNGIPVINPTNIINGKLIPSNKMMVSQDTLEGLSKYSLFQNDVIIARRGDLNKCGIVAKKEEGWLCGTGSFFLKLGINPIYFRLFYVSDFCQAILNADAIGSTMANLNQKVLANIPFPLPPLEEQKEIVRQVDKLFALADKLEEHYRKAKTKVDKLTQSVLAKAFRGELVPQDPNDEPAEKLLERIQEEKAKMEAELKKSSRKTRKANKE